MDKEEKNNDVQKKLLFFDNQSSVVKSLVMNLRLLEWDVTFVSDIDILFHEMNQNHYDIFILDIMAPVPNLEECKYCTFTVAKMNEMDGGMNTGVVLAKKIWELESYKETPILFLSGRVNPIPSDAILQKRHNQKKCDYLRKPQWAKEIDKKLLELLNLYNN